VPSDGGADVVAARPSNVHRTGLPTRSRLRLDDVTVSATIVVLAVVTAATLFLPGFSFATVAPSADLVLNAVAMTIAGGIAALAWIRFREAGQTHELFQASAFLALAAGGLITLALTVTGIGERFGFGLATPGQAPLYLWDLQRLTAGLLFVTAGWVGYRGEHRAVAHPFLVLLGPAVLLALVSGLLLSSDQLAVLRAPAELALLATDPQVIDVTQVSPGVAAVELSIAILFVVAAILFRRTYLRVGQRALLYLVLGLIVAASAQIHSIFVPTSYSGLVTSVDVFRVLFYVILLLGVATGARSDLRTLRRAHDEVRELRDADVRAAELQERARLAREMHDGLIQDLWLARLKTGHLLGVQSVSNEARSLAEEIGRALEAASTEARQALASLTPARATSLPLAGSLEQLVDAMSGYLEPRVDTELSAGLPSVPATLEIEILRIVREAIMNAGKHADATLVRVLASFDRGVLRLEVVDNGVGFDADRRVRGYGLRSMHERAESIGARLTIDARPQDGTRVTLEVPLGAGVGSSRAQAPARASTAALSAES
jgi:signal transduction histidine kinase